MLKTLSLLIWSLILLACVTPKSSADETQAKVDEIKKLQGEVRQLMKEEKYSKAEPLAKKMVRLTEQVFSGPEEQPTVAMMLDYLGHIYCRENKLVESERVYKRILQIREKHLERVSKPL